MTSTLARSCTTPTLGTTGFDGGANRSRSTRTRFGTVGRVPSGPDLDAPIYLAVDGGTNAVRKPKDATLSADSSWFLDNMAWTEWSATQAVGSGEEEINLCEPNCAEGKHQSTKAKVVLSAPRQLCGKLFYTTMKLTYGSGRSYVHEDLEPAC